MVSAKKMFKVFSTIRLWELLLFPDPKSKCRFSRKLRAYFSLTYDVFNDVNVSSVTQ